MQKRAKSITVRLTKEDYEKILEKAEQFTAGNLTAWIIYAASIHEPSEEELK